MKIAIIVLNWQKPQLTIDAVDSILKIRHPSFDYQILLIDNGSADDSLKQFTDCYEKNKHVVILETQKNLGYVGGNNFGIRFALKKEFDYVLLINNDVLVDPNFLENLFSSAQKNPSYKILGPKIYFAPGFEYHYDRYKKSERGKVIWAAGGQMDWDNILGSNIGVDEVDKGQFDQINTSIDFISGCCMLIESKIFNEIGLLDEKLFMYLEDVDFCQKAKLKGYELAYIPKSVIWHINAGSSKSGGELHNYFITRNRLIFAFRYANLRAKFALFRESIKMLLSSESKWKKQAIIDFYINKTAKGSWQ